MSIGLDERVVVQLLGFLAGDDQMTGEVASLCRLFKHIVFEQLSEDVRVVARTRPHEHTHQIRQAAEKAYHDHQDARSYHDQILVRIAEDPPARSINVSGNCNIVAGRDVSITGPVFSSSQSVKPITQAQDRPELTHLRDLLDKRLNLEELKGLCFELGIDSENLDGTTKIAKARELVMHMERRGELVRLRDWIKVHRPDIQL